MIYVPTDSVLWSTQCGEVGRIAYPVVDAVQLSANSSALGEVKRQEVGNDTHEALWENHVIRRMAAGTGECARKR